MNLLNKLACVSLLLNGVCKVLGLINVGDSAVVLSNLCVMSKLSFFVFFRVFSAFIWIMTSDRD